MLKPAILIVEDEIIIAIDLQFRLEGMGYRVLNYVSTGPEALQAVIELRPDLVLMDIMLETGGMDGIEAAALIRANADVPIIFLTAYADETTFTRSQVSDPDAYILKPFQERELDLTIRTVLQKHNLEKQLRQSETRYRTLFEQTGEAILILDNNAVIIENNSAATELIRMRGIEKAHTLHDIFPDHARHLFSIKWELFKAGEGIRGRFSFRTPDRQTRYIEYKIQGNFLPGMHTALLSNVTQGVAARRKIENLARFPAEAPNPILRISVMGDILYANAASAELLAEWRPRYGNRISDSLIMRLDELSPINKQFRSSVKVGHKVFALLFVYVPRSNYINIYATDITRQKQSERLTNFQKDVLEMIAKGDPLNAVVDQLEQRTGHFLGIDAIAAFFLTDPETGLSKPSKAEALSPELSASLTYLFNAGKENDEGHLNAGSDVESGDNAVLIHADSNGGTISALLRRENIHTLWINPVILSGQKTVSARFCVFYRLAHNPTPVEVSLVNIACKVTGLALERDSSLLSLYKQARVFENINDAVALTTSSGIVTEWNPSAEKMFGRSASDILGCRLTECGIFDRSSRVEKLIRLVVSSDDTISRKWTDEFDFRNSRGESGIAEVSFIRIMGEADGNAPGVLIVMRDVSLKKRVEVALSTSEANLVALIENTEDIICSLDRNMRLVTFNSAFGNLVKILTGHNVLQGMPLQEVFSENLFESIQEFYVKARDGEALRRELNFEFSGKPLALDLSINPIFTEEGLISGLSLFARDITLRKEAENELKRTNFELDSFVYRASHDLRAPLRSVLGLVNILGFETDEEQQKLYLNLIEKSVNKLDNFISDLTNFSRNSRLEVLAEPIDFNIMLDDITENLRYMENAESIVLYRNLDCESVFYSDKQRMGILLQNLISNAIKYQRQGRSLKDEQAWVSLTVNCDHKNATIVVEDNGKGIDPRYAERVFDMFFRASEDSYGSGLGLYIARQVADKLKGNITLESIVGQGTKFTIFLPNLSDATA
ncbi:MAG: PAS domain S-box protein [Bacteroidota bacterium]